MPVGLLFRQVQIQPKNTFLMNENINSNYQLVNLKTIFEN